MSKLYGLVVRWLFVSRNGIKVQFLGVVGFKSSTLTVYCLSSWFVCQQRKTYSNLCVLCWLSHLSWFWGPKYISPFFWPRVTNHDVKSKILKKWFPRSLLFFTAFYDVEKLRRKPKIFVKVIRRFWYVQHGVLKLKKIHQKQPKLQLRSNSSMLEKTMHVTLIKILRYNFFQLCLTHMSTAVCPSPR